MQDFITHCWREPFHEFMDSLRHAYDVRVVKPHLFICAFSLFQGLLESFFLPVVSFFRHCEVLRRLQKWF